MGPRVNSICERAAPESGSPPGRGPGSRWRRLHETLGEALSDAQRVGDDGAWASPPRSTEEARVDDVEVVEIMSLASTSRTDVLWSLPKRAVPA